MRGRQLAAFLCPCFLWIATPHLEHALAALPTQTLLAFLSHLPSLPPSSPCPLPAAQRQEIKDQTQTNLVNLRRTIYLTIMSALDFEEAGHKLLKMVRAAAGLENLVLWRV